MSLLGALVGCLLAFGVWYSGIISILLDRPRLYHWLSDHRSIKVYIILVVLIVIGYLIV
jgi:hypothetical protein